jgi:hypothetical protein
MLVKNHIYISKKERNWFSGDLSDAHECIEAIKSGLEWLCSK